MDYIDDWHDMNTDTIHPHIGETKDITCVSTYVFTELEDPCNTDETVQMK